MTKKKKRGTKKKVELTAREKLDLLIKNGKVLSTPIFEGDTDAKEEKLMTTRDVKLGYALVGTSNGMTFSADPESRSSDWFRADRWIAVQCKPEAIDEVITVLEDYCLDKLADYYEHVTDLND